jgi:predicted nucleic acid-binding protein
MTAPSHLRNRQFTLKYGYACITMKIVLDTSVMIAASRSRLGASFQLVSMLPTPQFQIALTIAMYTEHLPAGVTAEQALGFLRYLASVAHLQDVHFLWRPFLRDPDDDMVLECAVASRCEFIVTHNVRDFRGTESLKVRAITPADFLTLLRNPP